MLCFFLAGSGLTTPERVLLWSADRLYERFVAFVGNESEALARITGLVIAARAHRDE
jgi:hypothetical protein